MGYDLKPSNDKVESFHFGAFSFPILLEACGYLFSSIHDGGRWYCVFGLDERMGKTYPGILANDGFEVTAEEARIMARVARNFVAVQRTLPDENGTKDMRSQKSFNKENLQELMINAMHGNRNEPWPVKIRTDFTDKFEKFAEWAEQSGGFQIH